MNNDNSKPKTLVEMSKDFIIKCKIAIFSTYKDDKDREGFSFYVQFSCLPTEFPKARITMEPGQYEVLLRTKRFQIALNNGSPNHRIFMHHDMYLDDNSPRIDVAGNRTITIHFHGYCYVNIAEGIKEEQVIL